MELEKPEVLTRNDAFMDYYFTLLIVEQQKTNELLLKLLDEKGNVPENAPKKSSFFNRLFGK